MRRELYAALQGRPRLISDLFSFFQLIAQLAERRWNAIKTDSVRTLKKKCALRSLNFADAPNP